LKTYKNADGIAYGGRRLNLHKDFEW